MKSYKNSEGLIFKISNSGATDKVINIINKKGEREAFFAKGAKKQNSKKAYAIEIGNKVKIKAITGYGLPIITDINLLSENLSWKNDFKITFFLQMVCEILDKFLMEDHSEPDISKALNEIIKLEELKDLQFITGIFILKVLNATGHLPEEFHNSDMVVKDSDANKEDLRILKTSKFVAERPVEIGLRVNLSPSEKKQLLKNSIRFCEEIIGRELKSKKVIYSL